MPSRTSVAREEKSAPGSKLQRTGRGFPGGPGVKNPSCNEAKVVMRRKLLALRACIRK